MIHSETFSSFTPGKHLLITGAVHGSEPCGTLAINKIINDIKQGRIQILQGSVTFIPVCNPEGYKHNKRLIEENLARIFDKYDNPQTYEQQCATVIAPYIDRADVLLDIHSGNAKNTTFVFQDIESDETTALTTVLGFDLVVHGRPNMYPDDNGKDPSSYAHDQGKVGVVVECGQHQDPQAEHIAYNAIKNFMHHYGVIASGGVQAEYQKHVEMKQLVYMDNNRTGIFAQEWKTGDAISKGTIIATYNDGEEIIFPFDGYIILPKHYAQPGDEWFYLAEGIQ